MPANLVAFMGGKREIKFSLGTSDPKLAEVIFREKNAEIERLWHEHLHGHQYAKLSQRQISALAGEFYQETIAAHRDNPGRAAEWDLELRRLREKKRRFLPIPPNFHLRMSFAKEADAFLERKGLRLSGQIQDLFIEEFVRAKVQAAEHIKKLAGGDWRPDPDAGRFAPSEALKSAGAVDAMDMFERYADEADLADKTRRSWRTKLKSLMEFVGHDDLAVSFH
ncbi:hypothetical protein BJ123_14033 [Rhodopseudomonas thermotolerans]|uniref:DUF6538 domain-containing protein n=2 Tax=Rhodopseudomonas TaxID=1073 RepID=A0A336JYZ2_9BRAD|nr:MULTISPECIES: DUF6538 domain-containing protein [Rhodopseudomonas]RED22791.1 hypothetical protein BJ125_14033 [Rhodopseudomonas pentothenatexigens]REF88758.1 hypothetical protein BJ123_14033 [Rhodopseudomonas thermotolerans]SSW93509.1 hypothetical protein SAMN05892882_14033 [Rhodopseudomonas pentothenatexigens]